MLFVLRLDERGRDAQRGRRSLRRDVAGCVRARLPGAAIRTATGRLFVDSDDAHALESLCEIHGVVSVSPCVPCPLDRLEGTAVGVVGRALSQTPRARWFRLRVKRIGTHAFTSHQLAARLGSHIVAEYPQLSVRMRDPDLTVAIEIRGQDCTVAGCVLPGADRRPELRPREAAPIPAKFLVDQMFGQLVPWLRLLGFDTAYVKDAPDSLLVRRARNEGRMIITADRQLAANRAARCLHLAPTAPEQQLAALIAASRLTVEPERMFTRCTRCNTLVRPVARAEIVEQLPEAALAYDEFTACSSCRKVYWKGAQYRRIIETLRTLPLSLDASGSLPGS